MEADPEYIKRLEDLPPHLRKAYLEGDWNIHAGQMFSELRASIHIVDPQELPNGTRYFMGADWGYQHPHAMAMFGIEPSGQMFVVGRITGHQEEPQEVAQKVLKLTEGKRPLNIYFGTDIWNKHGGPSVYQQLYDCGLNEKNKIYILRAYTEPGSRVQRVNTIRKYISTKSGTPKLLFFRNCIDVYNNVAGMQIDPDKPEDVLKTNADENGFGGDDLYDAFAYGLHTWITNPNPKPAELPRNSPMRIIQEEFERAETERRMGWS
jgi:hypothetical protein